MQINHKVTVTLTHGQCVAMHLPDLRTSSLVPSLRVRASPPFDRYQVILFGDRDSQV